MHEDLLTLLHLRRHPIHGIGTAREYESVELGQLLSLRHISLQDLKRLPGVSRVIEDATNQRIYVYSRLKRILSKD